MNAVNSFWPLHGWIAAAEEGETNQIRGESLNQITGQIKRSVYYLADGMWMRDQELILQLTSSKCQVQVSWVDVRSDTVHVHVGGRGCVHGETHPGRHAPGRKPGNVVLKVDPSNPDHVHLVCWVVQSPEGKKLT